MKGKKGGQPSASQELFANHRIRAQRVLVIDEDGTKKGIMMTRDAIDLAKEKGLDLVEVAPQADPPVARILDYGKYLYTQQKRQRDARKKQAQHQLKSIKLRTKTEDHDLQTELKKAREFLEKGDRVKVHVVYRGREMAHPELGRKMMERVVKELEPLGAPLDNGEMQGRNLITLIAPHSKAQLKKQQKEMEKKEDKETSSAEEGE